jgi:hypothetical protein
VDIADNTVVVALVVVVVSKERKRRQGKYAGTIFGVKMSCVRSLKTYRNCSLAKSRRKIYIINAKHVTVHCSFTFFPFSLFWKSALGSQ